MTDQELVKSKFSDEHSARLAALSSEELSTQVIDYLESESSGSAFIDFDKLMGAGITLAKLQRAELSATVVRWILNEVRSRRADVGCAFLAGLWHPTFAKGKVDQVTVRRLADELKLVGLTKDAVSSYTFALFQASRTELTPETKKSLVEAAERIKAHFANGKMPREIEMQLDKILERAS